MSHPLFNKPLHQNKASGRLEYDESEAHSPCSKCGKPVDKNGDNTQFVNGKWSHRRHD